MKIERTRENCQALPQAKNAQAGTAKEAVRLTPSNAKLRELAAKYPPPVKYFEGEEPMPFHPVED